MTTLSRGRNPIAVVGGGAWGTALSIHLAGLGHSVRLWMVESDLTVRIRDRRDNPLYLPGIQIPEGVEPHDDMAATLDGAELVLAAVPSHHARSVYRRMDPSLPAGVPLIVATKGIEEEKLALPLDVAAEELGSERPLAVMSGPSFAREVAMGRPTAVVVASGSGDLSQRVQDALSSPGFRVYTNEDPVGVQLAGALKNVMAIAAGVLDGMGIGHNGVAALITRGLAEMSRLGLALGGKASTFSGLAGLGDLVLTCTGELSRNRTLGRRLAGGERLDDILASSRTVAEGVRTTRSALHLATGAGVEMPIVEQMHRILYEDGSPQEAVRELMSRPLTSERDPRGALGRRDAT